MGISQDVARILLNQNAVTLRLDPPYRYTSGILSPIYCDNRLLIGSEEARKEIVSNFVQIIKSESLDFDIVGGTSTAGIPWAAWIAYELGKPMCYIRGTAKSHGKGNQIEGAPVKDKKVLIIEDLISTGKSSLEAVNAVREAGGTATNCLAIFTYEMEKARLGFEESDCKLIALTKISTLISAADELSEANKEKVLEWNKDPVGWGSKMGFE